MKNYVQKGNTITLIAPADVTSGDMVSVGSFLGVTNYSALSGQEIEVDIEGVFELPKATADAINQGDKLYWDGTAKKLTKVAGTGAKPLAGAAVLPAANGVTTVRVRLMPTAQTGPA